MELADRPLIAAAVLALATAWLLELCPPLAAAVAAMATLHAIHSRGGGPWRLAGLSALPVLLAGWPTALVEADMTPPPGPVEVEGTCHRIRVDPRHDQQWLQLGDRSTSLWLRVPIELEVLPGDRVRAAACCVAAAIPGTRASLRAELAGCEVEPGHPSLPRLCHALRRTLQKGLLRVLPEEHGPLVCSLVLGGGTRLPHDVATSHRATGLSHLLAVSGAHAAMLAAMLGLQPFGGGRRRPSRGHLWTGLAILFVYGAVTGMEPPVFRALCSYALVGLGLRTGRRVTLVQGLCWPALCSAIMDPAAVLSPSFCLSYAAVVGLGLAADHRPDTTLGRWVGVPLRASLWATALTAPWSLLFFSQLAPWTILWTPVLAPLVALMLFLGLLVASIGPFLPNVADLGGLILGGIAHVYTETVVWADCLPGTPILGTPCPSPWLLAAATLAAGAWMALARSRRAVFLGCCLACTPHFVPMPPPAGASLHLLSVGHGQCLVLILPDGHTIVHDCGSLTHPGLAAETAAGRLGNRGIDLLVVSHDDIDHTSGVPLLLERVPVGRALLPRHLAESPLSRQLAAHGCQIEVLDPGCRCQPLPSVTVFAPDTDDSSDNDLSLWLRAEVHQSGILATADAGPAGIRAAISAGMAKTADILVLPHHGRSNAGIMPLLQATEPSLCLVSNRGGEGLSELGALAQQLGILTCATAVAGNIDIELELPGPRLHVSGGLPVR